MPKPPSIRLPEQWPKQVKSGVLQAIGLASVAISYVRGRAVGRRRLEAPLDQAETEIALLREELDIKDGRWARSRTRRRPFYTPIQRMRILQLRAARGWTFDKTARIFLIDQHTLVGWMGRLDEEGERALVQTAQPVNRFPDHVRNLVRQLKALFPAMGSERIAQILGRLGLVLGATTVRRIIRKENVAPDPEPAVEATKRRVVVAKHPGHTWHLDLTSVPIRAGLWVPWFPSSLPQRWPFCWCVAVVVDQFSRAMVGFAVFHAPPTSGQILRFLERAIGKAGRSPRYIISDRGSQFSADDYRRWCKRRGIRVRYGRLGQPASICIVERFIRSLKQECTRRVLMPFTHAALRRELSAFGAWYNKHRPHAALDGRTPREVAEGRAIERDLIETRTRWKRSYGPRRVRRGELRRCQLRRRPRASAGLRASTRCLIERLVDSRVGSCGQVRLCVADSR